MALDSTRPDDLARGARGPVSPGRGGTRAEGGDGVERRAREDRSVSG